jgi:hypothetical protein
VRTRPDTGILAETALKSTGFVRTHHPIVSHLAYGPRAQELFSCRQSTAWGEDSVMQWFEATRARVAVLGVAWGQGCSFIHRAEEKFRVPYRYHKRFQGRLLINDVAQGDCSETLFVRPLGVDLVKGYEIIDAHVSSVESFRTSSDEEIPASSASADDITFLSMGLLAKNPYCFIQNAREVQTWVRNAMEKEIASLSAEHRPV